MSSQAFSIGKQLRPELTVSPTSKIVPGPGAYQGEKEAIMKIDPQWKFGTGKRPPLEDRNATKEIGPGAYNIPSRAIEGKSQTMAAINEKMKKYGSFAPGPGAYSPEVNKQSYAYTMGSRISDLTLEKTAKFPGPGGYDPLPSIKRDPSTKFGTSKRTGIYNEKLAALNPSPLHYRSESVYLKQASAKFSFGKELQRHDETKLSKYIPGPGQYEQKQIFGNESPGKTISGRLMTVFEKSSPIPGPGTYSDDFKIMFKSVPSWKVGTSTRDVEDKMNARTCAVPSPVAYSPDFNKSKSTLPKWGFGTGQRGGLTQGKTVSPSMQAYTTPSMAIEGPKWNMGLKLEKLGAISPEKTKYIPGPGAYQPDYNKNVTRVPSYSMKGRHLESTKLLVPGPGAYESPSKNLKMSPSFGFGSSPQRPPIKETPSPGPGGYKIPNTVADVPTYSMPNRKDEFKYI